MSDHWYLDGSIYVLVRSGMPEDSVEIGLGDSYREAVSSLETTAIQGTGPDGGIASALRWARNAGWISDPDTLEDADDPGGKDTMETRDWETVDSYVGTYPSDGEDGACDVAVQIGQAADGQWYLHTSDDAGGSDECDDTAYSTEDEARAAAEQLASDCHEGEPGEDAEAYLRRKTEERVGEPDPDGEWCCYWSTALDDSGPRERYATEEQATAAAEIANADLHEAHRGQLLCGYDARQLVDGEWVEAEDES